MTLTAGSSLQNGRYIIQTVLRQSDFAVTYRAVHSYLEQIVILQTYNPTLRNHSGYEQFCQLFREEVRRRVKSPEDKPYKILDAFDEDGLPYAVFNVVLGEAPPKLRDWLPLTKLTAIVEKTAPPSTEPPTTLPPEDAHSADAAIAQLEADLAQMSAPLPDMEPVAIQTNGSNGSTSKPNGKATSPVLPTITLKPGAPVMQSSIAPAKKPRLPVIPIALMTVAVVGGLAGAGFGWAVRFRQPEKAKAAGMPEVFSNAPLLDFNNEQSFPPQEGWPVREVPELDLPEESYDPEPVQQRIVEPSYTRVESQEPIAVEEPLPEYDPYTLPTQDFSIPDEAIAPTESEVTPYKAPDIAPAPDYSPLPPRSADAAPLQPLEPPSKVPLLPPANTQLDTLPAP